MSEIEAGQTAGGRTSERAVLDLRVQVFPQQLAQFDGHGQAQGQGHWMYHIKSGAAQTRQDTWVYWDVGCGQRVSWPRNRQGADLAERGLDDRNLSLRRDHFGDGGGEQSCAAAVRELWVSTRETAVPVLSKQARRVPVNTACDREEQRAIDVSATAGERARVQILMIELAI
ncbi:hypothetical protein KL918_003698 [Ogataea parapolymorpha]|nr:hypothetical protein KL918_003698 [Ogataea parapolymorpha]KAG7871366.1 hypothetical protein KL916_004161 [Ogataea parapolymorpha]